MEQQERVEARANEYNREERREEKRVAGCRFPPLHRALSALRSRSDCGLGLSAGRSPQEVYRLQPGVLRVGNIQN